MATKKDEKDLQLSIQRGSEAQGLKDNPYFTSLMDKLEEGANEGMKILPSSATDKFQTFARVKEYLVLIKTEINSDIHKGKCAKDKLGDKPKKSKIA